MSWFVQLDTDRSYYYPGNTISGRAICFFNTSQNIRGIQLTLKGEEFTKWTERKTYYNDEEKKHKKIDVEYKGHNTFLNVQQSVPGVGLFGPGHFDYPFQIQLPSNVPGSFQGRYGGVYFTIAVIINGASKNDYTGSKQIIVISPINFNNMRDQLQLQPTCYSDDKTLCCWCCASDPITMEVHLEKEAFVVGETVKVRVEISNMSTENVESVEVKLKSTMVFHVSLPSKDTKEDHKILAARYDAGVGAHGKRTYDFNLTIPDSAVVPNFNICTLFKHISKLEVIAVLPSVHKNLKISTDVTIGHVGLGRLDDKQAIPQQFVSTQKPTDFPMFQFPQGGNLTFN